MGYGFKGQVQYLFSQLGVAIGSQGMIPRSREVHYFRYLFLCPIMLHPTCKAPAVKMSQTTWVTLAMLLIAAVSNAPAQNGYTVIPVTNGGTITGTVKWSGPEPRGLDVPVNKDPEVCDPESHRELIWSEWS